MLLALHDLRLEVLHQFRRRLLARQVTGLRGRPRSPVVHLLPPDPVLVRHVGQRLSVAAAAAQVVLKLADGLVPAHEVDRSARHALVDHAAVSGAQLQIDADRCEVLLHQFVGA